MCRDKEQEKDNYLPSTVDKISKMTTLVVDDTFERTSKFRA